MNVRRIGYWYFRMVVSLFLAILISVLFYASTFYVHEAGHLLTGSLVQIAQLKIPIPTISNWIWLWNIIPLPQQTRVIGLGNNTFFALGGSIFVLLFVTFIAIKLFDRKRKETWLILALPIVFFMHELVGNFLFGTDNWTVQPLLQYNQYAWLNYFVSLTPWAIAIIAFLFMLNHQLVSRVSTFLSKSK